MTATRKRMHTINANVVQGCSYEIFQHENLSYESFVTRKFSDVWYIQKTRKPGDRATGEACMKLHLISLLGVD